MSKYDYKYLVFSLGLRDCIKPNGFIIKRIARVDCNNRSEKMFPLRFNDFGDEKYLNYNEKYGYGWFMVVHIFIKNSFLFKKDGNMYIVVPKRNFVSALKLSCNSHYSYKTYSEVDRDMSAYVSNNVNDSDLIPLNDDAFDEIFEWQIFN